MANVQNTLLAVDLDTGELTTRLANLPRGGQFRLSLALTTGGNRTTSIDASTIVLTLSLSKAGNALPASIVAGGFTLNPATSQYEAELDMSDELTASISHPVIWGVIKWDGGTSQDFHVVFNNTSNSEPPKIYYSNPLPFTDFGALSINNSAKPTTAVLAGERIVTIDIPAEYQTPTTIVQVELQVVPGATPSKEIFLTSKEISDTQVKVKLSAKCPEDDSYQIQTNYLNIEAN